MIRVPGKQSAAFHRAPMFHVEHQRHYRRDRQRSGELFSEKRRREMSTTANRVEVSACPGRATLGSVPACHQLIPLKRSRWIASATGKPRSIRTSVTSRRASVFHVEHFFLSCLRNQMNQLHISQFSTFPIGRDIISKNLYRNISRLPLITNLILDHY